ncbi:flagellar protein FlaI [Methanofollis sp. W23]|nr:flagellar protein FlaI [Methanofollis sp. W23]
MGGKETLDLEALIRDPRTYGGGGDGPSKPVDTGEPAEKIRTPEASPSPVREGSQSTGFDDQDLMELKSAVDAIFDARKEDGSHEPVEDEPSSPRASSEVVSLGDLPLEEFSLEDVPPEEGPSEDDVLPEDALPEDVPLSSPVPEPHAPSRATRWSSGAGEGDDSEACVTDVGDLGFYSELILPKAATFDVEEFNIKRSTHHDALGVNTLPPEIDQLWAESVPAITEEARAVVAAKKKQTPLGFLSKIESIGSKTQHKSKIEEYDPEVHGPLVDLTFTPPPDVEEVELYPVNEPYAFVRISYDNASHEYSYDVLEPELTAAETELLAEIKERLFERLDISTKDLTREGARKILRDLSDEILTDFGITLTPLSREKIYYTIERDFLGDGLIDAIMYDTYIEDISCDGLDNPIFIFHSGYESIKTNRMYTDAVELDSFVTKLAQRAGKYISIADPILDATMSDGSRIQMTLGKEVTAHGSTFTIRKFKDEPITPTDLIGWGTFSPLSVAFLWLAVEAGKSAIFAGGTASGKTTALNAISLFIPPQAKIVSLEDTRELKLPHSNWIPSVTRESFDTEGKGSIDMYELLRAALRQRPEYMCVGEVRGAEAQTLFQAMSTGHVTYATMHADSVASVVHRLENPPLDVPRNMLNALDVVCIQVQARIGGQRIRRNKQIIEILDIDPRTNELITNEVFSWNQATDEIRYSGKSYILESIIEAKGWSEARMREELKRRQEILEWMRVKNIRHYQDVSKMLISYFRDADTVIGAVRKDLYGNGDGE